MFLVYLFCHCQSSHLLSLSFLYPHPIINLLILQAIPLRLIYESPFRGLSINTCDKRSRKKHIDEYDYGPVRIYPGVVGVTFSLDVVGISSVVPLVLVVS